MTISAKDEIRLLTLENEIIRLERFIKGAASTNQLNRLRVLCIDDVNQLKDLLENLEPEVQELLELTRKLQ